VYENCTEASLSNESVLHAVTRVSSILTMGFQKVFYGQKFADPPQIFQKLPEAQSKLAQVKVDIKVFYHVFIGKG
jgi:hypothetical protein